MRESYHRQVACSAVLFVASFLLSLLFLLVLPLTPVVIALETLSTVCFTWGLLLYSLRGRVTSCLLGFYGGLREFLD